MNTTLATTNEHNFGDGELFAYFGRSPKAPRGSAVVAIIRPSTQFRYEIINVQTGLLEERVAAHTKFWASRITVSAVSA
jgi:hypothetical protein